MNSRVITLLKKLQGANYYHHYSPCMCCYYSKIQNPILVHPAYSEQIVQPIVSSTETVGE